MRRRWCREMCAKCWIAGLYKYVNQKRFTWVHADHKTQLSDNDVCNQQPDSRCSTKNSLKPVGKRRSYSAAKIVSMCRKLSRRVPVVTPFIGMAVFIEEWEFNGMGMGIYLEWEVI
eukprot:GHVQ01025756.1.p1 GENE.GHVQ01025756.1~~GHVQ01025756.1.p1  ORF type:complete len:116 (-),score=5.15 GHVQ01025756.1:1234-1581(-)